MVSQKRDRFVFINMSPKTHQALFILRLSGSGFPGEMGVALHYREFHWAGKVQGLATPTFQLKRSYKEFSSTCQFTQWMIVVVGYKQTAMSYN